MRHINIINNKPYGYFMYLSGCPHRINYAETEMPRPQSNYDGTRGLEPMTADTSAKNCSK